MKTIAVLSAGESLTVLRRRARTGSLSAVHRALLDSVNPGWDRPALDTRWGTRMQQFTSWLAEHDGKPPRQKGADRDELERVLGNWFRTQLHNLNLSSDRRGALDRALPGWDRASEDAWLTAERECVAWVQANKKVPSWRGETALERRQASWLNMWRKDENGTLGLERRAMLDRDLPGWDEPWVLRDLAILSDYTQWMDEHGCRPVDRVGADKLERRLAMWARTLRQRRDKVRPVLRQALDRDLPGWDLTKKQRIAAGFE